MNEINQLLIFGRAAEALQERHSWCAGGDVPSRVLPHPAPHFLHFGRRSPLIFALPLSGTFIFGLRIVHFCRFNPFGGRLFPIMLSFLSMKITLSSSPFPVKSIHYAPLYSEQLGFLKMASLMQHPPQLLWRFLPRSSSNDISQIQKFHRQNTHRFRNWSGGGWVR